MVHDRAITLRLPDEVLQRADELVPVMGGQGDLAAARVTRSTILRLALFKGLQALEEEYFEDEE